MATPVKGKLCAVAINSSANKVAGVNWTLNIDPKLEDLSNFRDGRAKYATLEDATATFTLIEDEDGTYTASSYRPGALISASFFVNSANTKQFSGTFRIGQYSPKVDGQETHLKIDVTAELHGALTYPT